MSTRSYGQYCGLARALEAVGERWALLIVRDLLVGPKRFGELHRGLPGIPTNVMTTRLKDLEQAGVVQRRVLPRPASGVVYELTAYGSRLEATLIALGLWGAETLGDPRPDEVVTPDSLIMALRTTFRSEAARGLKLGYELRLGEIVIHARIDHGRMSAGSGALADADLVIETGPAFKSLLAGELSPAEALAGGHVSLIGPTELLERFVALFRIAGH